MLSIELTPEQTEAVRSNRQFQQLYGDEAAAIVFNLHLPDALASEIAHPQELSEMLGVSRRTVSKLAPAGVLKSYKIGRLRRFSVEDVIEYLSRIVRAAAVDAALVETRSRRAEPAKPT